MNFFKKNPAREQKPKQASRWLENISVGWKLSLIIIVLVFGFAGIFYSAYTGLQSLQYHISNIYDSVLVPTLALDRADIALGDLQYQLENLRKSTQTINEKLLAMDRMKDKDEFFSSVFQSYNETWVTTLHPDFTAILKEQNRLNLQEDEINTLSTLKTDFDNYLKLRDRLRITVAASGDVNENLLNSNIAAVGAVRTQLRHLTDLTRQFADASKKAAQTAYNQAIFAMGLTLAVSVGFGLFLAFVISRSIINRLGFLTQAARALQQGHLETRATTGIGGRDEIAQMAVAFDAMGEQLNQTLAGLEQRVADRTIDLEKRTIELENVSQRTKKRADQLQAVAQVGRAVTSVQNLDELLPYVTNVTSERLGFYHIGIFLIDKEREYAILSAANSEGGKRMLERGHKLLVGEVGIVGYVASQGKPRIAQETGADAVFFTNQDLPDTHSEMALPLKAGSEIIGVLDVQSKQSAAFEQEDIELLTILADQVSIAIQNARLFQDSQEAVKQSEATIRQYLRREWKGIVDEAQSPGYRFSSQEGVNQLDKAIMGPNVLQATQSGNISIAQENSKRQMTVPIKVRGQVIGVMHLQSTSQHTWEKNIIDITQTIADRVALAVENARLLESSQNQATRERTIGEITSKIGASVNLRNVLQTAVEELGRILPGSEVAIQIESAKRKE
jgi:GAF domain-containing protein/HAMP domain-containing protein